MKSNKWFKMEEKGELGRFDYSPKKTSSERRKALRKAVKSPRNSGLEVFHKLWGLRNVTIKSQSKNSIIYGADARYIKKEFYKTRWW